MKKLIFPILVVIITFSGCQKTFILDVTLNPTEGGIVNPSGGEYQMGSVVTIKVIPNEYYEFDKWSGDWGGSDNPLSLTMDGNKSLVVNFTLMDSDGDGVADDIDQCSDTPEGDEVDESGCASSQLDSDNDGVMDDIDLCSDTPDSESVDENGCSDSQKDSDEDGVMDDVDQCSDTPIGETVDENGCSLSQLDSDNDGVMDDIDQCSSTPDGESVDENGCSDSQKDSDEDGVMDDVDQCSGTPSSETVDENGCSLSQLDSDNDGVMDDIDQCPNTPEGVKVYENGCAPKTFGGEEDEIGYSVQQTTDGGYIITGYTKTYGNGGADLYLIKTNSNLETVWEKTFGGEDSEVGHSVQQSTDGGYIITGYTRTYGNGGSDVYLIKTNGNGETLWERTFGDIDYDEGTSVQQTTDGGYIIAGGIQSNGLGSNDVYLIKTDSNGETLWQKTFGGEDHDHGYSVQLSTDGGYIITGNTGSYGNGSRDVYLIKTNGNGETLWEKTIGGKDGDYGHSVELTTDGGYIITGSTYSYGNGSSDVYLIKTNSNGGTLWEKTFGGVDFDIGYSVKQTTDGGYIIAGETISFGKGRSDVYLIKTNSNGETLWEKTFGGVENDMGYSVQLTTDGGYIIVGKTVSYGNGIGDVYPIKTDSNGNLE